MDISNIEQLNPTFSNGEVTITPPATPTVMSQADYQTALQNRLNDLTQSQTNTQAQLDAISTAIADVNSKLAAIPQS